MDMSGEPNSDQLKMCVPVKVVQNTDLGKVQLFPILQCDYVTIIAASVSKREGVLI